MVSARVSNVQVFPPLMIFAGSGWIYGRSMSESIWRKKETPWSKWVNAYIFRGDHPMTNAGLEIKKKMISAEEKGENGPILLLQENEFLGMMKPQPSS